MVQHIVQMLIILVLVLYAPQGFLAQCEIVEFVLENDTRMVEPIGQHLVARRNLFVRERYLRQVIFTFVRIILSTVCKMLDRVFTFCHLHQRVTYFIGHFLCLCMHYHNRLVDTLPVIYILALSPHFLE